MSFLDLIVKSVPIRQIWDGNVFFLYFFLAAPISFGMILGYFSKKKNISFKNLALILPIFFCFSFFMVSSDQIKLFSLFFYFLYFSIFVFWGYSFIQWKDFFDLKLVKENSKKKFYANLIFLSFFCAIFFIIIYLMIQSPILGADSWSHLSFLNRFDERVSFLLPSPIFKGEVWHYPPLFYVLFIITREFISLSNPQIGIFLIYFCAIITSLLFYFFSREIGLNHLSSVFVALFSFTIPYEIGPKILLFPFFTVFLISFMKKKYVLSFLIVISLFNSYYLSIVILLIFSFIFSTLIFLSKRFNLNKLFFEDKLKRSTSMQRVSLIYLVIISFIFANLIYYLSSMNSPLNWHFFTLTSEIGLNPKNIISFFSLIFFPASFIFYLKKSKVSIRKKIVLISLGIFFLNSIFYYFKIFIFHMRYLPEISVSYLFVPLFAFLFFESDFFFFGKKRWAMLFFVIFIFCSLFIPIHIDYIRSTNHGTSSTNFALQKSSEFLPLLEGIENSIILMHPCDFSIRYLLYYTNNYIFAVNYQPNEFCNLNILTTLDGLKLETIRFSYPNKRLALAYNFFNNLSKETLESLEKKFKFDYILVNCDIIDSNSIYKDERLFKELSRNKYYCLMERKK